MYPVINSFYLTIILTLYYGAALLAGLLLIYTARRRNLVLSERQGLMFALLLLLLLHAGIFMAELLEGVFVSPDGSIVVGWAHDDGYISMRYAYNLAHGNGLVFNPGDRVEGFTNLGWTLVMTAVHLVSSDLQLNLFIVSLLNLTVNLILIAAVFHYLARAAGRLPAVLCAGILSVFPPLVTWGAGGMETPLQTLLIFLALKPLLPGGYGKTWLTLPLLGLAYIVRPDSALFIGAAGLWLLLAAAKGEIKWSHLLIGAACAAGVIALTAVFRLSYYGDIFPNTYYLKAPSGMESVSRGIYYIFANLHWYLLIYVLALAALPFNFKETGIWRAASFILVWLLYIVWLGGDGLGGGRFFIPAAPLVCCTAAFAVRAMIERVKNEGEKLPNQSASSLLPIIASLLFVAAVFADGVSYHPNKAGSAVEVMNILRFIRSNASEGAVVMSPRAGALPYYCADLPIRFHDPLGKVDRHIAHTPPKEGSPGHNKWDNDYSLGEVKPDLIITSKDFKSFLDTGRGRLETYDRSLYEHPFFRELYLPNRVEIENEIVPMFYRTGMEKVRIGIGN